MRNWIILTGLVILFLCWGCGSKQKKKVQINGKWIGIHLLGYTSNKDLENLEEELPKLKARGINLIFLEVDYSYNFRSHPKLRWGKSPITGNGALRFSKKCEENGIRLIPEFQCLGHQSWGDSTFSLLKVFPELDLTPNAYKDNKGLYCREWDPTNPRVNQIVFELIDEIVAAFDADGIHLGMDEVFLLDDKFAENTKDIDPASVYAKVINEYHDYFVKEKGLEMFIWGDRLIDGEQFKYGEYESSLNGTHLAIDSIPKDIIICDWHYEPMREYPSVNLFIDKGFRVLPSSYKKTEAVKSLIKHSFKVNSPNMLGHVFTTWKKIPANQLSEYPPLLMGVKTITSGKFFDPILNLVNVDYDGTVYVNIESGQDTLDIKYNTNGFSLRLLGTKYNGNIKIKEDTKLKVGVFKGKTLMGDQIEQEFNIGKSTGKNIILTVSPSDKYEVNNGAKTLVDGLLGSISYSDGKWIGLEGEDLELIVDFGKKTNINTLRFNTNNNRDKWVYQGDSVFLSISNDQKNFRKILAEKLTDTDDLISKTKLKFGKVQCRYAKIRITHTIIPPNMEGAGNSAWLFVDEVVLN